MDRVKALRWQQRAIPRDVETNLSPSEIEVSNASTCYTVVESLCKHQRTYESYHCTSGIGCSSSRLMTSS
jgi:hypothetical protein